MIALKDENEFRRILHGLADDVIDAHVHYKLYKDLYKAHDEFPLVMQQSNSFWQTTLKAHLNTSIYALTKVYDQHAGALHLYSFLQTVKANFSLFTEEKFKERKKDNPFVDDLAQENRVPNLASLDADISACSDKDFLVKLLLKHRGNSLAHRNAKNTASGKLLGDTYPLTFEDFEILLNRSIDILNRYSQFFEASSYSTHQIGADDFRFIFECVTAKVEQ